MNRADIREIAASLEALADAADRVVASFGIEPHISFGGALIAPQPGLWGTMIAPTFNPTPAETGAAGEDRDGGGQCHPAVAENLTDRQLRDQIVAAAGKPVNGSPWTEAEDVVLRDMLRANDGALSMNALAAKIVAQSDTGRTVDAIAYRLKNKTKHEIATTAGFRLGPLTDDERAEIMTATARGEDRPTIAGRLNRRVQAVALFLTAQTGPDGKAPSKVEAAPVVAPVAPAPVVAAPAAPADMPRWQVTLRASLNALGYAKGWDAESDYDMLAGLAAGSKTAEVALDLGKDPADMLARWKAIKSIASDEDGRFGSTEQERLLVELRARAMASRQVAA